VGWSDRLQQWLLKAGLIISAVLLIRFAIDFSEGAKWWLAAPFWLLVVVAVGVGLMNVSVKSELERETGYRQTKKALLLAAIPLGFLSSSLDCTGLSAQGCSPFCTFIKLVWIPIIVAACVVAFLSEQQHWLSVIAMLSFVPLVPHCVCYNVGNAWWIDRVGKSPLCYGWGFVVSMIALGALRKGEYLWASIVVCCAIVAGASAFFVTHHYFQFPW
jgi:hypothetical protein